MKILYSEILYFVYLFDQEGSPELDFTTEAEVAINEHHQRPDVAVDVGGGAPHHVRYHRGHVPPAPGVGKI